MQKKRQGNYYQTSFCFFFLIFYEVNASGLQFQYYRQASIWHTIKTKSKRPYTIHQEI